MHWCALVVVPAEGDVVERVSEAMRPLDREGLNECDRHQVGGDRWRDVVTELGGDELEPDAFLSDAVMVPNLVSAVVVHGSECPYLPRGMFDERTRRYVEVRGKVELTRSLRTVLTARRRAGLTDRVVVVDCHL